MTLGAKCSASVSLSYQVHVKNCNPIPLTSCLTAIKAKVIKYCETVYERSGKNTFWPIKILVKYLVNSKI